MIRLNEILDEVAYDGNLGFHEMFLFYNKADDSMIDTLENLIKRKRFKDAWKLVQRVTGTKLKGSQFENMIKGGLADGKALTDIANMHKVDIDELMKQLQMGIKVEMEHTSDSKVAHEIALDHLYEDPKYYTKLKKVEEMKLTKEQLRKIVKEEIEALNEGTYEKKEIQSIIDTMKEGDSQYKATIKISHDGKSTKNLDMSLAQLKALQKLF